MLNFTAKFNFDDGCMTKARVRAKIRAQIQTLLLPSIGIARILLALIPDPRVSHACSLKT
ncbi:MAG: hypothetical protein C1943_02150 [Halochromatium sp.]|nr:hypothetical protein [Halochromatium sp.]